MLCRIELEVLAKVDRGDTISELAGKLDHSERYLSRAVTDLIEKGLVYTERDGRRKRVLPSDARAVELYRDLVRQHAHIDFPELLPGKALEVLYYLDQPRTVSEIADRSDNYRNTVNRILKRFRDRGLVCNDDGRYDFNSISTAEKGPSDFLVEQGLLVGTTELFAKSHVLKRVYEDEEHPFGWMQDGVFELFDRDERLYRWHTEEELVAVTEQLP